MKTISKKIKTIYLLAIMAILSVCVAVFPVFKTETVKAESATGLSVTGAKLEFGERNTYEDFALMFQAEITKDWYDTVATEGADVKFGMAIGPKEQLSSVTSFEQLDDISDGTTGNAYVFTALVGNTDEAAQSIDFVDDETTFTYEAGTVYSAFVEGYESLTLEQWQVMYQVELTAIPFYSVNDVVNFDATINYSTSAVTEATNTLYAESALPVSQATMTDANYKAITGIDLKLYYTATTNSIREIYLDLNKDAFFANFSAGYTADTNANAKLSLLQFWPLYKPGATTLGTSNANLLGPRYGAYFAGAPMTATCPVTSSTLLTDITRNTVAGTLENYEEVVSKLIPGETYKFYFYNATSSNKPSGSLSYFTYKVVSGVFTSLLGSSQGASIMETMQYDEDSANAFKNSYFTYGFGDTNADGKSEFYLPYTHQQNGYTATTGYNGYYVLAGDLIVPDAVSGTTAITGATNSNYKNKQTHKAPENKTQVEISRISALKMAPDYTHRIDGQYVFNANCGGGFTGTFDGRGYTIDASFGRGGLFGVISGGTVKNLNIKADLYSYTLPTDATQVVYAEDSYEEKAATLAEVIYNGSTIENVSIELVENAPKTFYKEYYDVANGLLADKPEMDNVPGIIAAQGIYGGKTTLKNVIVKCDALKDANVSLQNFRAALNIDSACKVENLFVIGSSYTNMSIDAITDEETGTTEYVLTLSAPEGIEPGTYTSADAGMEDYVNMAIDMFKYMRNIDVSGEIVKVVFVAEKATGKFASDTDFQAWLNGDGADAKAALIATKMWKDSDGSLVWAKDVAEGTTYSVIEGTLTAPDALTADLTTDFYTWVGFAGYNPRVTIAG